MNKLFILVARILQVLGKNSGCSIMFILAAQMETACRRHSTTNMFVFWETSEFTLEKFITWPKRLRWSRGSVLAFGTQVRGFILGRSRRIFQGEKILSKPSFGKPFVPCRIFTACERSLNVTWKSGIFRQNSSAISRPCISSFHY